MISCIAYACNHGMSSAKTWMIANELEIRIINKIGLILPQIIKNCIGSLKY